MNAVVITFLLVVLTLLWRAITTSTAVQKCLHFFGPLTPFLQWYAILFVGVGWLLLRTFFDIVRFEYIHFDFLKTAEFLDDIPGLEPAERDALHISPWLRVFSLAAPAAGVLGALIVAEHTFAIVSGASARAKKKWDETPVESRTSSRPLCWSMDKETNMVLLVVAMPIVFIVMAMRAEIRIWAVMTGSAFEPMKARGTSDDWIDIKKKELSAYTGDIEMCGCFVYITIFCFGRLCTSYLRNAPPQYQTALKFAGLQGVYLYVIFGFLRGISNIVVAIAGDYDKYAYIASLLQDKVLVQIQPVFTVATVLCVYNVIVICGMNDIKKHLGNANLKFQGVRFLVLVAQIQLLVLQAVTKGSKLYQNVEKLPPRFSDMIHSWDFSTYRAMLMHAALLNFECLLVVVFQRCAWRANRSWDYADDDKVVAARELKVGGKAELEQPLLRCD